MTMAFSIFLYPSKSLLFFLCISTSWAYTCSRIPWSMKLSPFSSKSAETDLTKRGFRYILGSDESGTGCIAGPVVVATCCLLQDEIIDGVNDSKVLTPETRTRIYQHITNNPTIYAWNYQLATPVDISKSDTAKATIQAFRRSIERLVVDHNMPYNSTYSIVDGHRTPLLNIPVSCRPWKQADAQVYTVALASILAKVTLDTIMMDLHEQYPLYDFQSNKGYPTRQHVQQVHTHGLSPCHRATAKPIKGR